MYTPSHTHTRLHLTHARARNTCTHQSHIIATLLLSIPPPNTGERYVREASPLPSLLPLLLIKKKEAWGEEKEKRKKKRSQDLLGCRTHSTTHTYTHTHQHHTPGSASLSNSLPKPRKYCSRGMMILVVRRTVANDVDVTDDGRARVCVGLGRLGRVLSPFLRRRVAFNFFAELTSRGHFGVSAKTCNYVANPSPPPLPTTTDASPPVHSISCDPRRHLATAPYVWLPRSRSREMEQVPRGCPPEVEAAAAKIKHRGGG